MAQAVDIAGLMKEFQNVGAAQTAANREIDTAQGEMNKQTEAQVAATTREADLTGQVQSQIDQLLLRKEGLNKASAAEFGTNREASSYILGELGSLQIDKAKEIIASAQDIHEKQNVGFSDNPLVWLVNQFSLGRQVSAHNSMVAESEIIGETIQKLQAQTIASVQVNNSINANTSADIMALNSQRLLAGAEKEAARARQEAAKANLHVASVRLAVGEEQFKNVLSLNRAQIDLQQLQISQANLALSQEERRERLKLLQEKHQSDEALQEDLNRATATLGYRTLTPAQFRNMSGPLRNMIEGAMADPNIMQGRVAADPVLAAQLTSTYNLPLTPAKRDVVDWISHEMTAAQSGRADWQSLKPEQKHAIQLDAVRESIGRQMRNIPDQGGIFSAPPMMSLGDIPAVAATTLWKESLAPLAKNAMVPTSAQQIFSITGELVATGKMTLEQAAADVSTIYTAAVADNWHNRDYGTMSIKVPEQYRNSYTTRLKMPATFGGDQAVDMANETAVRNIILRYVSAKRASETGFSPKEGMFGFPAPKAK